MYSVTWQYKFCAAHRIVGHKGRCKHLHGHNYVAELMVWRVSLNSLGMVIDFADLKEVVGRWIDTNWDHNAILAYDDPILHLGRVLKSSGYWQSEYAMFDVDDGGKMPYVILAPHKPTAEIMANVLFFEARRLLRGGVSVKKATIFEQHGCSASYED
jgi:6-pyruvoyltetrahydropterin/6-carboxytetrahydropterin synthase